MDHRLVKDGHQRVQRSVPRRCIADIEAHDLPELFRNRRYIEVEGDHRAQKQKARQDYSEAVRWYRKAAEQGNTIAQIQLGNMYRLGKGVSQSYVMAYLWYDISSRSGNANAKDLRRAVAGNMSPAEIAEAKRMSAEWRPGKR